MCHNFIILTKLCFSRFSEKGQYYLIHLRKVTLGGGVNAIALGEFINHGEEGVQVRRRVGGGPRLFLLFQGTSGYLVNWRNNV